MSVARQPSNQGSIVAMTTWQGYHHGENRDEKTGREGERERVREGGGEREGEGGGEAAIERC